VHVRTREPGAQRADARANHASLLRVASQLIGQHGRDVPFEAIAKAAGVGRATVYRHFPTREDLLVAILEVSVVRLEDAAAELGPGPDTFLRLVEIAWRAQAEDVPFVDLFPPSAGLPPAGRELERRIQDLFAAPLAEAQAGGRVSADLTPDDVRMLLLMMTAVVRTDTKPRDRDRAWRLALHALGAR
jgi:AcrR family transcriptional regulator